ncbi:alpha/beta fold hydrolase [Variovorax sp. LjRoot290]|uniref:alpha/beta fold hydrolase n=1 Tax=unclassified Variovorax TaxID=663243 RepID=UPI003ECC3778
MPTQPDIRYVSSLDGTRLAMATWGSGPVTVCVSMHLGDWMDAPTVGTEHWIRLFAQHGRFVRYDVRGCGLSAREPERLSFDACIEDLEAVVAAQPSAPVSLCALTHGAPLAIAYAARHPERVSRLFVYGGYLHGRLRRNEDAAHLKETQAVLDAIEVVFGERVPYSTAFLRAMTSRIYPHATAQQMDLVDASVIDRIARAAATAYTRMSFDADVEQPAHDLRCPVLVMHARNDLVVPFEQGSRLAAVAPQARFVPFESDHHLPLETDANWPAVAAELSAFFGWGGTEGVHPGSPLRTAPTATLTARQIEVLRLVSHGHTDKQVAKALGLSPRTVEMHAAHAMQSLGCRSRAEAVRQALQRGMLE